MIPIRNAVYTVAEIYKNLSLQDAPFLCVDVDVHKYFPASQARLLESCNRQIPLQTTQVSEEELLALAGFADLQFMYLYTTHEWIPIFVAIDNEAVLKHVNVRIDFYDIGLYLTLKAFPHERYYGYTPECLKKNDFFAEYLGVLDATVIKHEKQFSLTHKGTVYVSALGRLDGSIITACYYVSVPKDVLTDEFTFTFNP